MRDNNLKCIKFTRRSRGYSYFEGEVGRIAKNKLDRKFQVTAPNKVWVTDVTEFKIQGSNQKMYYGEKFTSIKQLGEKITEYINWYNNKRIKKKLNGLSPIEYRQQASIINIIRKSGLKGSHHIFSKSFL